MSSSATGSPNMEVKVVSQEMALLSNILAAYTFIADQPERTALVFLGGVSVGLLVTLCAIVFQIHCRADCHYGNTNDIQHRHKVGHHHRQHICAHHQTSNTDPSSAVVVASRGTGASGASRASRASGANEPEVWDDAADLSAQRRRRFERALLHANMFTSSEELDRAQRLEERERILREIWMNGQPDISTVTQSLNRYY